MRKGSNFLYRILGLREKINITGRPEKDDFKNLDKWAGK
jgi:hypothetical protein